MRIGHIGENATMSQFLVTFSHLCVRKIRAAGRCDHGNAQSAVHGWTTALVETILPGQNPNSQHIWGPNLEMARILSFSLDKRREKTTMDHIYKEETISKECGDITTQPSCDCVWGSTEHWSLSVLPWHGVRGCAFWSKSRSVVIFL